MICFLYLLFFFWFKLEFWCDLKKIVGWLLLFFFYMIVTCNSYFSGMAFLHCSMFVRYWYEFRNDRWFYTLARRAFPFQLNFYAERNFQQEPHSKWTRFRFALHFPTKHMTYPYLRMIWRESLYKFPISKQHHIYLSQAHLFHQFVSVDWKIGMNVFAQKRMFWVIFPMCVYLSWKIVCASSDSQSPNQQPFGSCVKNRCSVRTCVQQWRGFVVFLLSNDDEIYVIHFKIRDLSNWNISKGKSLSNGWHHMLENWITNQRASILQPKQTETS